MKRIQILWRGYFDESGTASAERWNLWLSDETGGPEYDEYKYWNSDFDYIIGYMEIEADTADDAREKVLAKVCEFCGKHGFEAPEVDVIDALDSHSGDDFESMWRDDGCSFIFVLPSAPLIEGACYQPNR